MTSKEWKNYKLSDFMEFNPNETLTKGSIAKKVAMENLKPYNRDIFDYEYAPYNGGVKFRNGDTIMARITPCLENGKTSKVNILEDNEIAFGSTEYIVFRKRDNISDENFIYYLVTSPKIREIAIKSMVGSSGRQRVQADVLANLELELPPLETQKKIAGVLSSLDDKVELNNKINQNLEQQAQAIYNQLILTQDLKEEMLSEIIEITDGTHDSPKVKEQGYYLITSKHLSKYGINKDNANYISEEDFNKINERSKVDKYDILISMIGTVGLVSLIIEDDIDFAVKNVGIFKTSLQKDYIYFIFSYLLSFSTQNYIKSRLAGTTQKYISLGELRNLKVKIPNEKILANFNELVYPIYQKIINNTNEIKILTQLRDTLLPKLMSGEIDVDKVIN